MKVLGAIFIVAICTLFLSVVMLSKKAAQPQHCTVCSCCDMYCPKESDR